MHSSLKVNDNMDYIENLVILKDFEKLRKKELLIRNKWKKWVPGECLLCKHEGLSYTPRAHISNSDMVAHTCNPNIVEAEKGRSLGLTFQPV